MGEYVGTEETPEVSRTEDIAADLNNMMEGRDLSPTQDEVEQPVEQPAPTPEAPTTFRVGDAEYDAAMASEINGLVEWASSLTPEQYQAVNNALYGEVQPPEDPAPAPEPAPEPQSYDGVDDETAQILRRQEEELAALKEQIAANATATQETQQQVEQRQAQEAAANFQQVETQIRDELAAAYGIDQAEYDRAVQVAGQLGILNGMVQQHGLEGGIRQTIMSAMYADDQLRGKLVGNQVQAGVNQGLADERREAQQALDPQGGTNIPSQDPGNLPMSEKRQAMKADIDKMLGNF